MRQTLTLLVGVGGLLLVAGGCGSSSTVPVEGVVTLDGQPLEGAAVSFVPEGKGRPAQGETDAAGKFSLTTAAVGKGVEPGKYKVGVSKMEKPTAVAGAGGAAGASPDGQVQLSGPPTGRGPPPMPKALVPAKYLNPNTSEITVVVEKGMAPVQIELKSK